MFPAYGRPLPHSEGPRLHRFHDWKLVINFIRLLSDVESAGHAHVFEVSIGSKAYALKMVRLEALLD